jgi:hypothetical protein
MGKRVKIFALSLSFVFMATAVSQAAQARTLFEAADELETSSAPVDKAQDDFQTLESSLRSGYGYLNYYEKRWKFDFSALVRMKQSVLAQLGSSGQIRLYEFKALLS